MTLQKKYELDMDDTAKSRRVSFATWAGRRLHRIERRQMQRESRRRNRGQSRGKK